MAGTFSLMRLLPFPVGRPFSLCVLPRDLFCTFKLVSSLGFAPDLKTHGIYKAKRPLSLGGDILVVYMGTGNGSKMRKWHLWRDKKKKNKRNWSLGRTFVALQVVYRSIKVQKRADIIECIHLHGSELIHK